MSEPQDPSRPSGWAAPGASAGKPADDRPDSWVPADPPPGHAPQPPAYGQQPPAYGQQPPAYGQQPPAYGQQPPAYGQQPPAYGQQPPAYGQQPPAYGQQPPAFGQQPPAYGQAGWGPTPYGPPGAGAWRPPALQPGIIPLRPLSLGELLDGGVRAIRANPAVMFGLAAVVVTVGVVLSAIVTAYVGGLLTGPLDSLSRQLSGLPDASTTDLGAVSSQLGTAFATFAALPVTALATTILDGLLVVSVSRSVLGRRATVGEVARSWRVWWVIGFTLLMSLAVLVVGGVLGAVMVWAGRGQQWGWFAFAALVGGLAFAVAAVWVNTRTLLVTPALMLEGKPFWRTIARAWRLTRGSFWRLFGIALLVAVLVSVLTQIISVPFTLVAEGVTGGVTSFWAVVIISVGKVITLTAATTYQAAVIALLYIDVRMRREALDVELARAASTDSPA